MENQIKPLWHNILVKPEMDPAKLDSGLILPEAYRKIQNKGKVVDIGPGTPELPMKVKIGDTVLFLNTKKIEVLVGKEKRFIISQFDVIGVVETETFSEKVKTGLRLQAK